MLPAVELLMLVLAGGVLLGALSWYLVERPAQRGFSERPETEPALLRARPAATR